MSLKQRKTKFKPGIKLNHNIEIEIYMGHLSMRATIKYVEPRLFHENLFIITIIILLLSLSLSLSLLLLLLLLLLLYFNLKINNQAHF